MKKLNLLLLAIAVVTLTYCTHDDAPTYTLLEPGAGESTDVLLVKKFSTAPDFDGDIDEMWKTAQKLVSTATVPSAGNRDVLYNDNGDPEPPGVFEPYTGESYNFTMRSGYFGSKIYFLVEWEDAEDSTDRQSWYFDKEEQLWRQQNKYANHANDKFYEDKLAFMFPITESIPNWADATCLITCHQGLSAVNAHEKTARHYMNNEGELADMWHWKRVRGDFSPRAIDDKHVIYKEDNGLATTNGRKGDSDGAAGYHNNKQTLNNGLGDVSVPLYVIPDKTQNEYKGSIKITEIDNGTAKLITAVDANGVLTYDGGTIDPNQSDDYAHGFGSLRFPSVWIEAFQGGRADIKIESNHIGSGWVVEIERELNTSNPDDVVFDVAKEIQFGFAIFNNAAIAHGIRPNLTLKFEQ